MGEVVNTFHKTTPGKMDWMDWSLAVSLHAHIAELHCRIECQNTVCSMLSFPSTTHQLLFYWWCKFISLEAIYHKTKTDLKTHASLLAWIVNTQYERHYIYRCYAPYLWDSTHTEKYKINHNVVPKLLEVLIIITLIVLYITVYRKRTLIFRKSVMHSVI